MQHVANFDLSEELIRRLSNNYREPLSSLQGPPSTLCGQGYERSVERCVACG